MATIRSDLLHLVLTAAFAAACLPGAARAEDGRGSALEFHALVPIQGSLVGKRLDVLRGQAAGGLPWVIARGHATLHASGRLEVDVRGLVLADAPAVPPALRLTNPVPTFRAVVSCVTAGGEATSSQTRAVSATSGGDAHIEDVLDPPLPHPCFAPLLFVGNGAGALQDVAWFATAGVE